MLQGVYSSAWKDEEGGSKGGEEGKYEKKYQKKI